MKPASLSGVQFASNPGRWTLNIRDVNLIPIYLIFFTSSFDILLNLRIAGFSLRFCYLIILLLVAAHLPRLKDYALGQTSILGFLPLMIWTLFLTAFVGNTPYLVRNIGYLVWHYIDICFIIVLVGSINRLDTFLKLFWFYLASYTAVAAFGLLQFSLGLAGISLLVEQWWMPRIPRINGFSYEPSYFGTYLAMCWFMLFALLTGRDSVIPRPAARWGFAVLSLTIVLSSSRMTILVCVLMISAYAAWISLKGLLTLKVRRGHIWVILGVAAALTGVIGMFIRYFDKIQFLLAGLAFSQNSSFGGGSNHSTGFRLSTMVDTWKVFIDSPFIGVSLGGVASTIAAASGLQVTSNEIAKDHEGMNIFLEVLAASGIVGYAFFLKFLYDLFAKPIRLARSLKRGPMSGVLTALVFGLFLELLMLAMNQNILRPFLWVHIGMLCLAYKISRRELLIQTPAP